MRVKNIFLVTTILVFTFNTSQANEAKQAMERAEAKQKVRINTGYSGNNKYIRRRSWRGEECDVNVGRTYVEEKRHGREINVYSVAGDVTVRCD